jgi:hypothetical protein
VWLDAVDQNYEKCGDQTKMDHRSTDVGYEADYPKQQQ